PARPAGRPSPSEAEASGPAGRRTKRGRARRPEVPTSMWSRHASGSQTLPPVAPDEGVRGAVVPERGLLGALQLGDDPLRERLPELHPPLIERVDLPYGALREDAVLVERDQRAEGCRRQALGEDGAGRPIALERP